MQIYFNEMPEEVIEYDEEGFEHEGKQYYYCIDIDEDCFHITDTCGRGVPFGLADLHSLMNALIATDYYTAPIVKANKCVDRINSDFATSV
jgi:hypothetical protein